MSSSRNVGLSQTGSRILAVDGMSARVVRRPADVVIDHASAAAGVADAAERRLVVVAGHSARAWPRPAVRPAPIAMTVMSAAEQTRAARVGAWLFRYRGVLPIPVLLVPLCVHGSMTSLTWAAGLVAVAIGELMRLSGVAAAGPATRRRTRCVPHLVTDGAFAWARNPIYIGNAIVWTGVAIATGVLWYVPLAFAAFAVEYGFIVRYEEGVLESTFGTAYLAYKERTPRWIPRWPSLGPRAVGRRHDWRAACRSETSTLVNCAAAIGVVAVKGLLGG
jgi:protein-S-isoprenylcysteine O-methyltransferase Ste14